MKRNERGIALVFVLAILAIALSLGAVGARSSRIELRIANNDLAAKQALTVANGGIRHAFALIAADTGNGFDDELANGGTGGALAPLGSRITLDGETFRFRSFGGFRPADGYFVRVEDNWDEAVGTNDSATDRDHRIRIVSVGRVGIARRRIEATLGRSLGPDCAFTTNDDLDISGNPTLTGEKGCAHTNADLDEISGNPSMSKPASASGTLEITGNPTIEGTTLRSAPERDAYEAEHSGVPVRALPSVRPLAFGDSGLNLADAVNAAGGYLLSNDCRVYQGGNWNCLEAGTCTPIGATPVANLATGGKWRNWDCNVDSSVSPPRLWKLSGNGTENAPFFVMGWVDVSGNPGSAANPWRTTVVAMNSISISGSPNVVPFTTTGPLRNLLLVSGNDVSISGNFGQSGSPGAIFAHQQVKFSGNPAIHGFVVAEDGASTWPFDPAPHDVAEKNAIDSNRISGNPTLTYAGLDTELYPGSLSLLTWREIRTD